MKRVWARDGERGNNSICFSEIEVIKIGDSLEVGVMEKEK